MRFLTPQLSASLRPPSDPFHSPDEDGAARMARPESFGDVERVEQEGQGRGRRIMAGKSRRRNTGAKGIKAGEKCRGAVKDG